MSRQVFPLSYSDEKEKENLEWAKSNVTPWAKPLNDQRVLTNGTSGSLGSNPLVGSIEAVRAFFIRNTK